MSKREWTTRPSLEVLEHREVPSAVPTVDLTTRGSSGVINDAIFRQADNQPTGTGHIDSFLRVQGAASQGQVQQGYNTSARPLQYDENKSPQFTRTLHLSDVPRVNLGGVTYREFLLDINQKSSQPLLSLDELRLYLSDQAGLRGYDPSTHKLAGLDPVYDMDAGALEDNWVLLDYRLNSGSGSGDMLLFVPDTAFASASPDPVLYLYSKFGVHYAGNAGFQEWAAPSAVVTGSISGVKFNDLDGNGVRDAGEQGLGDWVIYIDANNNGALDDNEAYTITDANGNYTFTGLATGLGDLSTYRLREVQQDGWTQTAFPPELITLDLGQSVFGVDFGNHSLDTGGGGIIPS
jgi:hypothetical protein